MCRKSLVSNRNKKLHFKKNEMSLNWHFPGYILLVLSVLTLSAADVFQFSLSNAAQMAFFSKFLEFIFWTIYKSRRPNICFNYTPWKKDFFFFNWKLDFLNKCPLVLVFWEFFSTCFLHPTQALQISTLFLTWVTLFPSSRVLPWHEK